MIINKTNDSIADINKTKEDLISLESIKESKVFQVVDMQLDSTYYNDQD